MMPFTREAHAVPSGIPQKTLVLYERATAYLGTYSTEVVHMMGIRGECSRLDREIKQVRENLLGLRQVISESPDWLPGWRALLLTGNLLDGYWTACPSPYDAPRAYTPDLQAMRDRELRQINEERQRYRSRLLELEVDHSDNWYWFMECGYVGPYPQYSYYGGSKQAAHHFLKERMDTLRRLSGNHIPEWAWKYACMIAREFAPFAWVPRDEAPVSLEEWSKRASEGQRETGWEVDEAGHLYEEVFFSGDLPARIFQAVGSGTIVYAGNFLAGRGDVARAYKLYTTYAPRFPVNEPWQPPWLSRSKWLPGAGEETVDE